MISDVIKNYRKAIRDFHKIMKKKQDEFEKEVGFDFSSDYVLDEENSSNSSVKEK